MDRLCDTSETTRVSGRRSKDPGLQSKGIHAVIQTAEKRALQGEFIARGDLIKFATTAFGMGIDRANIRNVVHFDIPSSFES